MKAYDIQGLEELRRDFMAAVNEFPYESERKLEQLGKKFKKAVLKRTPTGGETSRARDTLKDREKKKALSKKLRKGLQRKSKKALDKSYKTEIKNYGEDMQLNFFSTAPHFHLIERGHRNVAKDGREIGFVPGQHMVEKTAQEFETVVPQEVDRFLNRVISKLGR